MTSIRRLLSLAALYMYMTAAFSQVNFGTADTTYVWQDIKQQFSPSADFSAIVLTASEKESPATLSTQSINPSEVSHWHLHFSMIGAFTSYNYTSLYLAARLNNDGSVAEGLCVRIGGNNNKSISVVRVNADGSKSVLCESPKGTLRPDYPFSIDVYRTVINPESPSPQFSFAVYCDINDKEELVCESCQNPISSSYFSSLPITAIEIVYTKTYAHNKTLLSDFYVNNQGHQGGELPIEPTPIPEPEPEPEPEPIPDPEPEPQPMPSFSLLQRGDVVINEIMYHPSPDFGLPEVEWVELHNNTDSVVVLSNWTWCYSSSLPESFIEPHGYVVLCAQKHADTLSPFSKCRVYPTSSWPELLNSAKPVFISDAYGRVIDYVYYDNSAFKNNFKAQGGWSLERIDPLNLDGSMSNWMFSDNTDYGATLGYANSCLRSNVDITSPQCLYALMSDADNNSFRIYFSEPMDTVNIPSSIVINSSPTACSLKQANRYGINWLDFSVDKNLLPDRYYTLDLSGFSDLAGNVLIPQSVNVGYSDSISTSDVVINEIMSKASPASLDYVELYNRSRKNIDLFSLCIASMNDDITIRSLAPVLSYHRILFPNEYLVVTKDSLGVVESYNPANPKAITFCSKFPTLPAEGTIAIASRNGTIVDICSYSNSMHSPLTRNMSNVSLERIYPGIPSSDVNNWASASELYGYATPTARNSQYRVPTAPIEEHFKVTTRVFSPSSVDKPGCAVISSCLSNGSWHATLQVYSPGGYLIATPYNNALMPTSGELTWNGLDDSGVLQSPGTYIVYISAWQTEGKTSHFKSTVTILAE